MKIRFKEDVQVKIISDICCFSGLCDRRVREMKVGDILEVVKVPLGPFKKPKIKTRPGQHPWKYHHSLVLDNDNKNLLHPDRVEGIPEGSFEIIND